METNQIIIPVEEGKRALDFLRNADLEKTEFEEIKKKTDILVRCGFAAGDFAPLSHWIFRGVVLKVEEIPSVKKVGRISYRPKNAKDLFSLNRASSNRHEVFYGGIPTPDFRDAHVAAILEIDNIRNINFPEDDYEYIGLGLWFVKKPFLVASLGMNSTIAENNQWARSMANFENEFCETIENGTFINDVSKFMASEFGKEIPAGMDHLYKISAAYGDSLFDVGVGGIMYPSLQTKGKSFNIAIKGNMIDAGYIDIEAAAIIRGMKAKDKIYWGWFLHCERVYGDELNWVEPPSFTQITGNDLERFKKIVEQKAL